MMTAAGKGVQLGRLTGERGHMATQTSDVAEQPSANTPGELDGKHLLISGAFSKVIRATALAALRSGARVTLMTRRPDPEAEAFCRDPHARPGMRTHLTCALNDPDEIHRTLADLSRDAGPIDILVNVEEPDGGQSRPDMIQQAWNDLTGGHLTESLRLTTEVLPGMKEKSWGRVINLGTGPLRVPELGLPHMRPAHGALIAMTVHLALQVARDGITVNAVTPGYLESDTAPNESSSLLDLAIQGTPIGRLGRPGEIAEAILFLASPGASYITGQILAVNGGLTMQG